MRMKLLLGLSAVLLAAGAAYELKGPVPVKAETDWHARAEAWFDSADDKARKKQMRTAGRALKRPCKYCHGKKFDTYTDKLDISRQMMALSKEHGVACGDCHLGKSEMSDLGKKAQEMWALSHERGVFCESCHTPGTRFKELTEAGKKYDAETKKAP